MQKCTMFPYSWHIDEKEEDVTSIRVYGLNESKENICVRINNFTPFVYLELPDSIPWTSSKAQMICNKLDSILGDKKPLVKRLIYKKRLYYAHINPNGKRKTFPYLFLSFSHHSDIRNMSYKIRKPINVIGVGIIKLKMHEQDASPILQFTSYTNISTAGWCDFVGKKVHPDEQKTLCDHEYKVKWKNFKPNKKNTVASPLIMGFDIEVNSTNPSAMPKAEKPGDKVFQVSCVLFRHGDDEKNMEKYLLTLGEPDPKTTGEDVEIYMYETEHDLLIGYTEFIQEKNPNVIVGYNILNFDIPYMIDRAKMNYCIDSFDQQGFIKYSHSVEKTIKWSSSAYGNQTFQFLDAEGRLYVDLLPLVKRDYKMDNYKLKTISTHFLGATKDPLSVKGIFKCYRIGIKHNDGVYSKQAKKAMAICGKYCLCENTRVSGKHGSIPIENLYGENLEVLSWNEKTNKLDVSVQSNFFDNGKKECIELELEDGRTITCTPDHKLVTENGWIDADDIPVGGKVKVGPILPEVELDTNETIYARVLGYMITDGHISKQRCVGYFGNLLDAQVFCDDIKTLCGIEPEIMKKKTDNCWLVSLPKNMRYKILTENWIKGYNRTGSKELLPYVSKWSKSQIREFIAGMFGGDGWSPCYNKGDNKFTPIGFTQSRNNKDYIEEYMGQLSNMLKMFDIIPNIRISKRNNLFIGSLYLSMYDIEKFVTTIGYRYCYHKTIRASIATFYYRIKNKAINSCRQFYNQVITSDMSISGAYRKYVNHYVYTPSYGTMKSWIRNGFPDCRPNQVCRSFPKVGQFLNRMNAMEFFGGDSFHSYSLGKNDDTLPTFELSLISKKSVGIQQVYDITVEDTHSFLANGIVAHNCVQDSALVIRLFNKLQTWIGLCEMAKTTNVPIFYLYTQGQQIKVYSQLYKFCMYHDFIVEKDGYIPKDDEHYVGATVFEPKAGVYDRVLPFDFASLYPTTIIAYNIDYSTLVNDPNIPDRKCHVMEWEDHCGCIHDKTVRKTKPKHIMCCKRHFRFLKEPKGVMPTVLENLLGARAYTRKQIKILKKIISEEKINDTENESVKELIPNILNRLDNITHTDKKSMRTLCDVLDKRQLAYKVSANSMYGAMGVTRGYLPFMPGAMATTAMGRKNIGIVAKTIPEKFGGKLIYGDTDTLLPDSPLIIKNKNGYIEYRTMEELSNGEWKQTVTGKEISMAQEGLSVWSDIGFTPIKYVIRHAVTKPLIRVTTHIGSVECTLDHSLLWENGEAAKASDVKIDSKLCISEMPLPEDTPKEPLYPNKLTNQKIEEYIIPETLLMYGNNEYIHCELAFVLGLFYADGSCGKYRTPSGVRSSWAINNQDNKLLNKCLDILNKYENDLNFIIMDTMKSSGVNKLVPRCKNKNGSIVSLVKKYRDMFYDQRRSKRIPNIIFNSPFDIRQSFFMGYYAGDGSKKDPSISCSNKGAIGSAGLFYLMKTIGYKVSINVRQDKPDIYKLTGSSPTQKFRYCPNKVKKIEETAIRNSIVPLEKQPNFIPQPEYIYDIETENHHFAAGVGQLVVHNSNYIVFPHLKTAQENWDYAEHVASEVTKMFPAPIKLEFEEEIYWRFFILTKKRYMYKKCGRDGVVEEKVGKKGVLLARRDNSVFIRNVYETLIMKVFNKSSKEEILGFVIDEINKLCSGYYPYTDFIITKAVGDHGNLQVTPFFNEKNQKKGKMGQYTVPLLSNEPKERARQFKLKNCDNPKDYYIRCLPAVVQLAERMRFRGQRVDSGTRLEYVISTQGGHKGKQYEKVEDSEYFKQHQSVLRIDYLYYLKLMANPFDDVLNVLYDNNDNEDKYKFSKDLVLNQYKHRSKTRVKLHDELSYLLGVKLTFKNN